MPSRAQPRSVLALASLVLALAALAVFLVYLVVRYTPIIGRIFEEKPLFLPLRVDARDRRRRRSASPPTDGLELAGTYLPRADRDARRACSSSATST